LMFFGKCSSGLESVPATLGGGKFDFEAYFYWNSKIIPKENNGVLVRINNASGTLFDKSFMDYQVSELTRLRQLSAEVFILDGLDAALNIDRESFNFSHPHYQFLMKWVHVVVRQITNKLKALGKEALESERSATASSVEKVAMQVWNRRKASKSDLPPDVVLYRDGEKESAIKQLRAKGAIALQRSALTDIQTNISIDTQIKGVVIILDAYGVLENLAYAEQTQLIHDLLTVLKVGSR